MFNLGYCNFKIVLHTVCWDEQFVFQAHSDTNHYCTPNCYILSIDMQAHLLASPNSIAWIFFTELNKFLTFKQLYLLKAAETWALHHFIPLSAHFNRFAASSSLNLKAFLYKHQYIQSLEIDFLIMPADESHVCSWTRLFVKLSTFNDYEYFWSDLLLSLMLV